jgi:uncharacterized membrane protein YccC
MFGWRSPNLVRLLVGQHIVNGVTCSVGVILVAFFASSIVGFEAGLPAWLGALAASISDYPAPWREKARTLGLGFALALASTSAIQIALPWPPIALLTIGAIAFAGGIITGLGRWAVAVGMQALIPMVFMLGFPPETLAAALRIEALFAAGGVAYIAFALLSTIVTDASSRRLVAGETIREFSIYLRAVAAIFDPGVDLEAAYGAAIRQQAALSEQLQSARSLLLDHARSGSENIRLAATIGVLLDALDALIASQCDVPLIRNWPGSARLLGHIDAALRVGALDLQHLSYELLTTGRPLLPPDHQLALDALRRETAALETDGASDKVAREALVAAARRILLALQNVRRLERTLSDNKAAEDSIGEVDLLAFIPQRSYSLRALAPHFTLSSPVLRFSVRVALAMMAGSVLAQSLGESGHGNWVLLTIAVVMRAGYGLTRQRRNDRVVGTLIGCVAAAGAVATLPVGALVATQGLGVGVTHSFARLNYRVASVGASVTALVSLHLAQPSLPAPILVRLADTLIGAAIAHLFSYVWPHWEFAEAPRIATRLQAQLAAFAAIALKPDAAIQDYRLARKNMIEALSALSDSAGRMSIEPTTTRKGLDEMAALLIAAHGLIAELSATRLDAQLGVAPPPDRGLGDRIQALLAPRKGDPPADEEVPADAPPSSRRLAAAALAVVKAAQRYRRAAEIEAGGR